MANKLENIRLALTGPLNGLLPNVDIVYENQKGYTPVQGRPYIGVFLLPNQPSAATNGVDGFDAHTGVLQLSLNYPREGTDFPLLRAYDAIESEYQKYIRGQYLSSGGISVKITSVGIGSASSDGKTYFAPVNINYLSYIKGVS